jgi:hypothetical protein
MSIQAKYVCGFTGLYSPVCGKGNNSGVDKFTFPLSIKEAREMLSNRHKFPGEPDFVIYRLMRAK